MDTTYYTGFDIGSSAVHYAVLDTQRNIVYAPKPIMHFANPIGAIRQAWQDITQQIDPENIRNTAFTGSGAESYPDVIPNLTYAYDSITIPKGAGIIYPNVRSVLHIGAKDAYFFSLRELNGKKVIQEWKAGSKCGSGTGTLIQKQCRRLFQGELEPPELENTYELSDAEKEQARIRNVQRMQHNEEVMLQNAHEEACKSTDPSEFLARCGVVVQSDLIHKQNEGVKRPDNLAGLFNTVARNYRIDVLGNETLDAEHVIATGGVIANGLVWQALEGFLDVQIVRPEQHFNVGAIGAAAIGLDQDNDTVFTADQLNEIQQHGRQQRQFAEPLYNAKDRVHITEDTPPDSSAETPEVVLGIDGGSTTTKGALVDVNTGKLLDKLYIKTHGDPEASLKKVVSYLSKHRDSVRVKGVGTTGSARKLYEKILLSGKHSSEMSKEGVVQADKVTDEITCHGLGVKHYNPDIDTIFEVGGQDMKFTTFDPETGNVRNAKMNYSCQAGSGQTLENMADIIGLDVRSSLQDSALRAQRVPLIDATCGVFMEMDENRLIAEGFSKEEIAAAIIRGTAASYYFKFVGGAQTVGNTCSAQGGPCLGKAFLAALAQVSEKQIYAYPHREMFGAWGAALDVINNIREKEANDKACDTAFRGWQVAEMAFNKEETTCREYLGKDSCGVRNCKLQLFHIGDDTIVSGGFCPKGNSETVARPQPNYVDIYHKIYEKHFRQYGYLLHEAPEHAETVGIRRSTSTVGPKGVWSAALLQALGFVPVVTPKSDYNIARAGIEHSRTDFCIARKLATGHTKILNEHPNVRYLFNPAFIEVKSNPNLKYCIYTQSEPYLVNGELFLDKNRQMTPVLEFGEEEAIVQSLKDELKRLGFTRKTKRIREALQHADEAERSFRNELYRIGDKFLQKVGNQTAYVGLGRDYVLLDPEASSYSGAMFSQVRGMHYIPQPFLKHRYEGYRIEDIATNEYWVQSVDILKAHQLVTETENLFGIRMMNFGCGPDSMKLFQEEQMQDDAGKPLLTLLTDAQTNNAPFVTRAEAFERVVEECRHEQHQHVHQPA